MSPRSALAVAFQQLVFLRVTCLLLHTDGLHISATMKSSSTLDGASLEPTPAPTVAPSSDATGSPIGNGGTDAPSALPNDETRAPVAGDATAAPSGIDDIITIAPVASPTAAPVAGGTASPAATGNGNDGGIFETSSPTAAVTDSPSYSIDAVDELDILQADGNNDTVARGGNVTAQQQSLANLPAGSTNLGLVTTKQLQPFWQIQTGTVELTYIHARQANASGANDVRGVAVKDAAVYLAGVNAATAVTNSTSK
eukprot:15886-Heterococcus_DN1.PRE.1